MAMEEESDRQDDAPVRRGDNPRERDVKVKFKSFLKGKKSARCQLVIGVW